MSYIKSLEQFMNYCTEKHKAISNNISNATTSNYKRQDVEFNQYLENNITELKTNKKHIPLTNQSDNFVSVYKDTSAESSGDNSLNIEKEMSEMAANSIAFKLSSKFMSNYYKGIQYAIKGDK